MAPLTEGRNTPQRIGDISAGKLAANALIYPGALLMRNAAGFILAGETATGSVGVGRAEEHLDNTGGANGDLDITFRTGVFRFANSAAADEITIADIGEVCFIVDDQTVAATSGTDTRSPAGTVADVDALGVWVRFDEALTKAA
ncbi:MULTISPECIES: hypothetical protein [unclassified Yoonia]|uniref:hypothetical protein n=1 Tax=unclassified Yoonia TaxID=2629118 RepID=UPI002AFECBC8|nr:MULTISPECIES: hypothetical protein [unclassified Yoonia]